MAAAGGIKQWNTVGCVRQQLQEITGLFDNEQKPCQTMSEPEGKRRYIAIVSLHNASYNEMHTSNISARLF